jgi:hypothetical protein
MCSTALARHRARCHAEQQLPEQQHGGENDAKGGAIHAADAARDAILESVENSLMRAAANP